MSTSDELYGMLETLKTPEEFAQLSDTMKFIVTRMQRDMEKDRRIPKDRYEVMVREQQNPEMHGKMQKMHLTFPFLHRIWRK